MTESAARRVALVTGCGKRNGIGRQVALALAAAGDDLVVSDLEPQGVLNGYERPEDRDASWAGLPDLVRELEGLGASAASLLGDVRKPEDAEALVAGTVARYGRLDILVNVAGAPQGADTADIADVPLEAWDAVFDVNARGTFLMCRAAVPRMRERGWGRIVNISSMAGRRGIRRLAVYCASKAAVIGLSRAVALDVAAQGITVNAVCPGHIRTSRTRSAIPADQLAAQIPVGRYGEGRDVAGVVAYLASDAAAFVTAQAIAVDGGELPA